MVGNAGGTEQRHGERVGTLQVSHKELHGLPGARKRSQGQQQLPQHGKDFSVTIIWRWHKECLTQHMELRHLRDNIIFHFPEF